MSDRTKVSVSPEIAEAVVSDLDDAIRRRSPAEIRNFAVEARNSGLDQAAARGFEIADLLERKSKAAAYGRGEVQRLMASLRDVSEPTQDQLAASFDAMVMSQGVPFDRDESPLLEARRIAEQNEQLAAKNAQAEETARTQVARDEPKPERPWWR